MPNIIKSLFSLTYLILALYQWREAKKEKLPLETRYCLYSSLILLMLNAAGIALLAIETSPNITTITPLDFIISITWVSTTIHMFYDPYGGRTLISQALLILSPLFWLITWLYMSHSTLSTQNLTGYFLCHWISVVLVYGFVYLAIFYSLIIVITQYLLHHKKNIMSWVAPPLLTMETEMFFWIKMICAMLTLSLITGWIVSDYPQEISLKNILPWLTWLLFGQLLIGRHFFGWRGQMAAHWLGLGMFLLLALAILIAR